MVTQKLSEEELGRSEEKYRLVIENANEAIVVAQDGMHKFFNRKALEITGCTEEEYAATPFLELIHPEDRDMVLERHSKRLKGEDLPHIYPFRIIDKTGNEKWLEINAIRIDWEGRPATLNFLTDITSRKHAEDALRESEERFRTMYQESPMGIELFDQDGQLFHINKASMEMFGISDVKDVIGFSLFEDPNLTREAKEALRRGEIVRDEVAFDFEKVKQLNLFETTKSDIVHLDVLISPLGFTKGEFPGYLVQIQDISHRKQAEEHIHILTQELLKAQENERQMISRELHDRVGQDLSTLKIGLDTLFDNDSQATLKTRERISELSKIIQGCVTAIRDLAYDLRPPSLDQLGMVQTIFQYCEDFSEKTGLHVDFTSAGMEELKLNFDTEINLYRLIQEGLNNIRKHADAGQATIRIVASFPHIILRIEDDGKGFDVRKRLATLTNEKRMGLRSMEERVSLLQGKMRIQSRPMLGTRIFIEVPYKERQLASKEKHSDR